MSTSTRCKRVIKAYRPQKFNWQPLIDRVIAGETQTDVAKSVGVPQQTLNDHYRKYVRANEQKQPALVDEAVGRTDGRKRSRRALSDAAEQKLVDAYHSKTRGRETFVERNLVVAAKRAFLDDHDHLTRSEVPHEFVASKRFIHRFKKEHHISSGRTSKRHKPNTYPTPEQQREQTTQFLEETDDALQRFPSYLVINADETFGRSSKHRL